MSDQEEIIHLIQEQQIKVKPTDEVEVREHDLDEYYESPVDLEGYYCDRMKLRE
jgi:hypothetical protein